MHSSSLQQAISFPAIGGRSLLLAAVSRNCSNPSALGLRDRILCNAERYLNPNVKSDYSQEPNLRQGQIDANQHPSFDCSGFIYSLFVNNGARQFVGGVRKYAPGTTDSDATEPGYWQIYSKAPQDPTLPFSIIVNPGSDVQPQDGDLILYSSDNRSDPEHVGIYDASLGSSGMLISAWSADWDPHAIGETPLHKAGGNNNVIRAIVSPKYDAWSSPQSSLNSDVFTGTNQTSKVISEHIRINGPFFSPLWLMHFQTQSSGVQKAVITSDSDGHTVLTLSAADEQYALLSVGDYTVTLTVAPDFAANPWDLFGYAYWPVDIAFADDAPAPTNPPSLPSTPPQIPTLAPVQGDPGWIVSDNPGGSGQLSPGGTWISPADGMTAAGTLHFAAHAYPSNGGPAIDHVNFTAQPPGGNWFVVCQVSQPSHDDVYECDGDMSNIAAGNVQISFDVYDRAGNKNLAPNGTRTVINSPQGGTGNGGGQPGSGGGAGQSSSLAVDVTPGSVQAGASVTVHATSSDSSYNTIRVTLPCGSPPTYELGAPEVSFTWSTAGCQAGGQTVTAQARTSSDPQWANAIATSGVVTITGGSACNSPSVRLSFSPGSAQSGSSVTVTAKSSDTSYNTVRVTVPCGAFPPSHQYETGAPTVTFNWATDGCPAGTQNVIAQARQSGDVNWTSAISTAAGFSLSPAPPTPTPVAPPPVARSYIRCGPGYLFSGCSANGEYGDGPTDTAWHGADGDLTTQWSSLEHLNSYWQATFQAAVPVSQVSIWGRGGGDTLSGQLQFSDGSTVDFGTLNGDGCRRSISFPTRTTTFVRFQVTGMGNRNTTGFRDIEAYKDVLYPDGDSCSAGGPLPAYTPPTATPTATPTPTPTATVTPTESPTPVSTPTTCFTGAVSSRQNLVGGALTISGVAAPIGTRVTASYNGALIGCGLTTGSGVSLLQVNGADGTAGAAAYPAAGQSYQLAINGVTAGIVPSAIPFVAPSGSLPVAFVSLDVTQGTATETITLSVGWHLFSFTVQPSSTTLADVLHSLAGHFDIVLGFDAAQGGAESYFTAANMAPFNTLTDLKPLRGYWIHLTSDATLTITGTPPDPSAALTLTPGWNLVGFAGTTDTDLVTSLSPLGANYDEVLSFDPALGGALSYFRDQAHRMFNNLDHFQPHHGYWIHVPATTAQTWAAR